MEPVILALEEKYDGEVAFVVVDVDDPEGRKLLEEFNVRYIPAFYYIDQNGNVVGEDVGGRSFEHMENRILLDLMAGS